MSRSSAIKSALARKKASGQRISRRPPFGKRLHPNGVDLLDDLTEQRALETVVGLARHGFPPREIQTVLENEGLPPVSRQLIHLLKKRYLLPSAPPPLEASIEERANALRKVLALRQKTIANGCTAPEAQLAQQRAAEIQQKYALSDLEISQGCLLPLEEVWVRLRLGARFYHGLQNAQQYQGWYQPMTHRWQVTLPHETRLSAYAWEAS